jgi:hypothetical protein
MPRTYTFFNVQLQFKMATDRVPSLKFSGLGLSKCCYIYSENIGMEVGNEASGPYSIVFKTFPPHNPE